MKEILITVSILPFFIYYKDDQRSGNPSKMSRSQPATLSDGGDRPLPIEDQPNTDTLRSQLKSPHFFSMTGIPKFGKNWLDNFIPDEDL
jgi:hypothetical protein